MRSILAFIAAAQGLALLGFTGGSAFGQSACLDSQCFRTRQVRDFEIIDQSTLIVYVGQDRCPFRIEVEKLYCNINFLSDVAFFDMRDRRLDRIRGATNSRVDPFGTLGRGFSQYNGRICSDDTQFGIDMGTFIEANIANPGFGNEACRITAIEAMSDDMLLEYLVLTGRVAPPPPVGGGELSRATDLPEEDERAPASANPESSAE